MLRLRNDQPSMWESVLPEEVLKLSEELSRVDAMLEDERFFAPFREKFYTRWGRPTIPLATYLRRDSFTWRRFCQLSFNDSVPAQIWQCRDPGPE